MIPLTALVQSTSPVPTIDIEPTSTVPSSSIVEIEPTSMIPLTALVQSTSPVPSIDIEPTSTMPLTLGEGFGVMSTIVTVPAIQTSTTHTPVLNETLRRICLAPPPVFVKRVCSIAKFSR